MATTTGALGSGPNALRAVLYDMAWTFPIQPPPTIPILSSLTAHPPGLVCNFPDHIVAAR
jgi:hypothetical protein